MDTDTETDMDRDAIPQSLDPSTPGARVDGYRYGMDTVMVTDGNTIPQTLYARASPRPFWFGSPACFSFLDFSVEEVLGIQIKTWFDIVSSNLYCL